MAGIGACGRHFTLSVSFADSVSPAGSVGAFACGKGVHRSPAPQRESQVLKPVSAASCLALRERWHRRQAVTERVVQVLKPVYA